MLSAQCTDVKVNMVTPALFLPPIRRGGAGEGRTGGDRADHQDLRPVSQQGQNLVLMARELTTRFGGEVPADHDALESLPGVGRKTANVVMRLCVRRGRHRRGYARLPRRQPAGAGRCARRAQNRASAHAKHPAEPMEPRAPLADLSRPPRAPPESLLWKLHPARMVRICQRQSKRKKISAAAVARRRIEGHSLHLRGDLGMLGKVCLKRLRFVLYAVLFFPADAGYYQPDGRRPDCDRLLWLALPRRLSRWFGGYTPASATRCAFFGMASRRRMRRRGRSMPSGGCRMNWQKSPRWMGRGKARFFLFRVGGVLLGALGLVLIVRDSVVLGTLLLIAG